MNALILLAIVSGAVSGWLTVGETHQELQVCGWTSSGAYFLYSADGGMDTIVFLPYNRTVIHHAGGQPVSCKIYAADYRFLPGEWYIKGVVSDAAGVGINYHATLTVSQPGLGYMPYLTGGCDGQPCDPLPDPMRRAVQAVAYPMGMTDRDAGGLIAVALIVGSLVAALAMLGRREQQ